MQSASKISPQVGLAPGGLTQDDIARLKRSFAEDGYVVLRGVVSKERLAHLRASVIEEFDRASRSNGIFSGGGLISGHLNCFPGEGSRFIYDELQERGVIDLIKSISPQAVRLPNVGCNLNLPKSVVQHYHVDSHYFTEPFMVCNTAVVDTDLANGAIDVIPGTHKRFYKFWRFALSRASRARIRIPMKQGDVLLRTSNLWHRGMPNHTTMPRPMVALTWEEGGSRREDPFGVDGGAIKFHPNWYRPNLLGRLRERTYVLAPITYDVYRFAASLVENKGYAR